MITGLMISIASFCTFFPFVIATTVLGDSIQESQQDLQASINRQVQQSITDTIDNIDNNTSSSSPSTAEMQSQIQLVNNSANDLIRGGIASLQNDSLSNDAKWIVGGVYKIENLSTTFPLFNASFYMTLTNGSSPHSHEIYDTNLRLIVDNDAGNDSTILNGTSTVTMGNGPMVNVPTTITLLGENTISIWLDPLKLDNHFGNSLIFGTQSLKCIENINYCR
jgi:hypothetical protein